MMTKTEKQRMVPSWCFVRIYLSFDSEKEKLSLEHCYRIQIGLWKMENLTINVTMIS